MKTPYLWASMEYDDCEDDPQDGTFDKQEEERRQLMGKGIITKHPADKVVEKLLKIKNKSDIVILFDFNHGTKYGEMLKKAGFHGVMAQDWAFDLERKREKAGELVKKYYKDVAVPKQVKFGTGSADKMIQFMEKSPDIVWVVKPNAEGMTVFCPRSEEAPIAMQENINHIEANKDKINGIPMILQEKAIGVEINIETGYYKGKPVYSAVDLENKYMDSGEMGHQSGCAMDLGFFVPLDCELRRMCNEPFDQLAKKMNFTGLMDMNAIISQRDGKPYFLEFCPNRFGYNFLYTEIEAYGKGVDQYLKDFTQGEMKPPYDRFAASIKLFSRDHYEDFYDSVFKEDFEYAKVNVEDDDFDGIWMWDLWKDGKEYRLAHYDPEAGAVTAASDTPEGAFEKAKFKAERAIEWDGKYARGDVDQYTRSWHPIYRYKYLRDRRLLEAKKDFATD